MTNRDVSTQVTRSIHGRKEDLIMSRTLKVVALIVTVLTVGCATGGTEYYDAMRRAAEAQAVVQEARYDALSKLALSGDSGAASAAVMAIALTREDPIVPQFIESDALKWAQVMVPSMTTLVDCGFKQTSLRLNRITVRIFNSQVLNLNKLFSWVHKQHM